MSALIQRTQIETTWRIVKVTQHNSQLKPVNNTTGTCTRISWFRFLILPRALRAPSPLDKNARALGMKLVLTVCVSRMSREGHCALPCLPLLSDFLFLSMLYVYFLSYSKSTSMENKQDESNKPFD